MIARLSDDIVLMVVNYPYPSDIFFFSKTCKFISAQPRDEWIRKMSCFQVTSDCGAFDCHIIEQNDTTAKLESGQGFKKVFLGGDIFGSACILLQAFLTNINGSADSENFSNILTCVFQLCGLMKGKWIEIVILCGGESVD